MSVNPGYRYFIKRVLLGLLYCCILLTSSTLLADNDKSGAELDPETLYQQAMIGDIDAQYTLFLMYRRGVGVERSIDNAIRWLTSAGTSGHAEAQYWLGYIYFTGQGVERDIDQAIDWYTHSAKQGYNPAEFILGHIYNGERYRFFERDPENAIIWYTKAAEHGNSQASIIMGCKNYYGIDINIDKEAAHKWFQLASMQGETSALEYVDSDSENNLHELCERVPRV